MLILEKQDTARSSIYNERLPQALRIREPFLLCEAKAEFPCFSHFSRTLPDGPEIGVFQGVIVYEKS